MDRWWYHPLLIGSVVHGIDIEKPAATVSTHAEPLQQFLQRVLQHDAPIVSPQDLAWFLAGYARTALKRIEDKPVDTLQTVREALEEALGLEFQGARGERFFTRHAPGDEHRSRRLALDRSRELREQDTSTFG